MRFPVLNRKLHRIGAILSAPPLLLIITSGLLLQLKKDWGWIQPPTLRGEDPVPTIAFSTILEAARSAKEAGLRDWDDIDRLDVRPGRGVVKVRGKNNWEVQVDTKTGAVLQAAYRRSDWIEDLHDGSLLHDVVKFGVFLPAGILLLVLWLTGIYLFLLPHLRRRGG